MGSAQRRQERRHLRRQRTAQRRTLVPTSRQGVLAFLPRTLTQAKGATA
ncbi:hypothetical protein [Ktedonobacter sp. SOSP1-52]|nr:hypothetical protein [Ktedonobacter sp. SOSP1-52]